MKVFDAYAKYYELLYQDKDYQAEVNYLDGLIRRFRPNAKELLDLGCGTGTHAHFLSRKGYRVTGVDLSESMVAQARAKYPAGESLDFHQGDLRSVQLGKRYEVITALFHVMSYQVTNDDVLAAFENVKTLLTPGGLFIFDCWYGPGVLTDRPVTRVKRMSGPDTTFVRIAEPVMHPDQNTVEVNYTILARDAKSASHETIEEKHQMRYFFAPEIKLIASTVGFACLHQEEWLSGEALKMGSWNAVFILERS